MRRRLGLLVATLALASIAAPAHAQFVPYALTAVWGNCGSPPGYLSQPYDVAISDADEVFVTDLGNNRISVFNRVGSPRRTWGSQGSGDGQFQFPTGIAIGPTGEIFVTDAGNGRVQVFAADGTFLRKFGTSGAGTLSHPWGIDIDTDGLVYVMDTGNSRIKVFTSAGVYVRGWPVGVNSCDNLALDHLGHVWVADWLYNRVREFSLTGVQLGVFGDTGTGNGFFDVASTIACDADGRVYVGDNGNHVVQVLSNTGAFLGQWGNATLFPTYYKGLDFDHYGYLFVVEPDVCKASVYFPQLTVPAQTTTWGSLKSRYR